MAGLLDQPGAAQRVPARDQADRGRPALGQRMAVLGVEGAGELEQDGLVGNAGQAQLHRRHCCVRLVPVDLGVGCGWPCVKPARSGG